MIRLQPNHVRTEIVSNSKKPHRVTPRMKHRHKNIPAMRARAAAMTCSRVFSGGPVKVWRLLKSNRRLKGLEIGRRL